ncbi:MAG: hypothetical protein FD170_1427 [Bacteroidetes bacterium]|nr:MAG: hypothetical protein FD170_1427 [Bacteroidota bacterium]
MIVKRDILLDENYDLLIEGGDFVVGDCLNQQVALLLLASKGNIRSAPNNGVGLPEYLLGEDNDQLNAEIRLEFKKDNLKVRKIMITSTKLTVDAEHGDN